MKHRILFSLVIINLFLISQTWTQENDIRENVSKRGTTAASFLEIGIGARALALGSAFTALADGPSTIFWNAAGLAKLHRNGIIFNHTEWLANTRFEFMGAAFDLKGYGAVGLSLTALTMDDMEVTTVEEPEGTGQIFKASDFAVSLAYALQITDRFSIGMNAKVIRQAIWEMSATGFAADLGIHYATPFKGLDLGMSMTNFGTTMRMDGPNSQILHDPDPSTSGNNNRIPGNIQMDKWPLPLNFRIGLAYQLFNNEFHKALIAVDAEHPNNNYESLNIGGEYVFKNVIALRGGYKSLFLQDAEESFTVGAGLNYPIVGNVMVKFDFAYVEYGLLESIYKYSLGIDF